MLNKILKINCFCTKTVQPNIQATDYLLKQLKDKSDIAITKDNHQIYAGVIIRRDPIFLKYLDWELDHQQFQYQINKKYKIIPEVPKELFEFDMTVSYEDRANDNPTHMKIDDKTKDKTIYREQSKYFQYCGKLSQLLHYNMHLDPTIDNDKSIQTCSSETVYLLIKENDRWVFPTSPVRNLRTFMDTRNGILYNLSKKQDWKAKLINSKPKLMTTTPLENQRWQGIKTYYWNYVHISGKVDIKSCEFAWVPRFKLNKYMNREDYNQFVNYLDF